MRSALVRTKIKEIEESLEIIENNLPDNVEDFSRLGIIKDGIFKRLEYSVESVFDICAILNADYKLGIPDTDKDLVDNLVQYNILPREMKEKLGTMKGFRNIVVHRYGQIDDRIVFNILKEHLNDFYDFIDIINDHLEKNRK